VFNNCYGQIAYGWQLSQKPYVLDNVANNYYMTAVNPPVCLISNHIRTYQRPYVHTTTREPQPGGVWSNIYYTVSMRS